MSSYEEYLQDLLELKNKEIDLYKNFIEKQLRCTIQENVEKELICNRYRIEKEYFKTITIPESKFAIRITLENK